MSYTIIDTAVCRHCDEPIHRLQEAGNSEKWFHRRYSTAGGNAWFTGACFLDGPRNFKLAQPIFQEDLPLDQE